MSHTMAIELAAVKLAELVESMGPDDEIVLTRNNHPVARIIPSPKKHRRKSGTCKGMLVIRQEDEEHLKDFAEYMP